MNEAEAWRIAAEHIAWCMGQDDQTPYEVIEALGMRSTIWPSWGQALEFVAVAWLALREERRAAA
jgi:hypothetical protein